MMTAEYSSKNYREAMTKEQQCKVALEGWGEYQARRKEYQEYCPKSKSNNIIFCPKKIINREKDEKVQWINDYFKNLVKRSKKEKTKKKGKEKRNKKKKIKKKKKKSKKKKKKSKKKKKEKKSKKKKKKRSKKRQNYSLVEQPVDIFIKKLTKTSIIDINING